MKRFFSAVFFLSIGCVLGLGYRAISAEIKAKKETQNKQISYATQPVIENKPFVVITYAKENEELLLQNLLSSLSQDYSNFRVVFIDDGLDKDPSFIKNYDLDGKITYIKNEEPLGSVESLYRAVHGCKSDEIVVLLRNGEVFTHNHVLDLMNRHFADPALWALSGAEVRHHSFEKVAAGDCYQAFYAGLFKHIKLQDFLRDGHFPNEEYENVMTSPLLELAGEHSYLIPDLLIISPEKMERKNSFRSVKYLRLKENPWHDFTNDEEQIDIAIFSYNRPLQLFAFLESSEKYVENIHRQFVIYRAGNDHYEQGYRQVKEAFPNVIFMRQSVDNPYEDFGPIVLKTAFDRNISPARFIAFALDDNVIKDHINLKDAAKALKETGAYGFYFRLGNNLEKNPGMNSISIKEGTFAWQFSKMEGEWAIPNSVNMTLFKKEDIYPYFLCMKFHNPNILETLWNEHADLSQVGLYYESSKVVNLPLNIAAENEWVNKKISNISTKDLLTLFEQGLKMDINCLSKIENLSVELDFEPEFIKR